MGPHRIGQVRVSLGESLHIDRRRFWPVFFPLVQIIVHDGYIDNIVYFVLANTLFSKI